MLADAIRSEAYRFGKNRMGVFWTLVFVPVIALVISVGMMLFTKYKAAEFTVNNEVVSMAPSGELNLLASLMDPAGDLANPLIMAFLLIGAATVYAGDYRWETFRLITARNARPSLVLGKVVTVIGLAVLAMVGWFICSFIGDLIQSVIFARPLTASITGEQLGDILALTGLGFLRLIQFTMLSLVAAALTRSLLAALFVPLVITIGQFFLMQSLPLIGLSPADWLAQLLVPGLGYDMLKATIEGGPAAAAVPDNAVLMGLTSLGLWTVIPLALALAWFQRQDLSKE